jgi:hypothetical protein
MRELEKHERYFDRFVVTRVSEALEAFEKTAPYLVETGRKEIVAFATANANASLDDLIEKVGTNYRATIFSLKSKLRFAEKAFGEGDGTLWPRVEQAVTELEDGVQQLIAELAIPAQRNTPLENAVRDRAASLLQVIYAYDTAIHRLPEQGVWRAKRVFPFFGRQVLR